MRFRLLCVAVLATSLTLAAHAQDVVSPAQAAATAALEKRIVQLEDRLKKLEEKFEKPMTVKAPFIVADGSGKPVLQVGNAGGRFLTLGPDSAPSFKVSDGGNETLLTMKSGANAVYLKAASGGASIVSVTNGQNSVRLISNKGVAATEVTQGTEVAQLGVMEGSSRIKLWKSNKPYFLATAKTDPFLAVGDESNPNFFVQAGPQVSVMRLAKAESFMDVSAMADGTELHVRNGQSSGASMGTKQGTSSIRVYSPTDSEELQMAIEKNEPSLTLTKGGNRIAELGTPAPNATALRIYEPTGEIAVMVGKATDGRPALGVLVNDQNVVVLGTNEDGEGVLELSRKGKQLTTRLGRLRGDDDHGLSIFDTAGRLAVSAGVDDDEPFLAISKNGKLAASMGVADNGGGSIAVWQKDKSAAELAVEDDGNGIVSMRNGAGEVTAMLGTEAGEGFIELLRGPGKVSASLGSKPGRKTALRIFNGTVQAAGIGLDKNDAGSVRIFNTSGHATAAMDTDKDGGGAVVIYDAKQALAAALAIDTDGDGAIQLYHDGHVLSTITAGANGGMLQLNDNAGNVMVQAGNRDGVGVVEAGPIIRAGGTMGIPGSFIKGRRQ